MVENKSRIQGTTPKEYNGTHYRSTLEADTAKTLDLLGIPFQYESKKITLLEGFRCDYQKDKVRAVHYIPDFIIGNIIIECKGFETPEWKIKKKYVFKYLSEKEPHTFFYQTHDSGKDILLVLDNHWKDLGYQIQVTSKPTKKQQGTIQVFPSIKNAFESLSLQGKAIGSLVRSFTGKTAWVYGYNWKLIKLGT